MTDIELKRLKELHNKNKWSLKELNELGQLYKKFYEVFGEKL